MAGWTCAGCTTTYTVGAARCPHCGSTERTEGRGGAVLPSLTVECANGACPHAGKRRRVHLRTAAPGVLEMPRLVCAGCGYDMPTVAPWPPVNESEDDMPKITVHGGASNAAELPEPEPVDETSEEGGEDVSAGSSSETSSEKEPSSPATSKPETPKRARTTGSRSKRARTADSSAPSTAGGPEADTSAADNQ